MHTIARHPRRPRLHASLRLRFLSAALGAAAAIAVALPLGGCSSKVKPGNKEFDIRYQDLGVKKDVPPYMKGTIWELTNRTNDEPYPVAGYALVGRLRGTGDSTAS